MQKRTRADYENPANDPTAYTAGAYNGHGGYAAGYGGEGAGYGGQPMGGYGQALGHGGGYSAGYGGEGAGYSGGYVDPSAAYTATVGTEQHYQYSSYASCTVYLLCIYCVPICL
jgi:hypothetical protein